MVKDPRLRRNRNKPIIYDQAVLPTLKKVWEILKTTPAVKGWLPFLPEIIPVLEKHGEISLDSETRKRRLEISAATIDRLLKEERKKWQIKGKSTTKPKDALKAPDTNQDFFRLE